MSQPGHTNRALPLDGVTVIDLSQIYNGPYATFLLATAGATVIKIEPPGGESLRRRGVVGGAALPFAMLNGCKQSLELNLKAEDGKQVLRDLVRGADVLVENFAPGVMERLGLGCAALQAINPRLVYAQSSGFGSTGPYRDYPAMDLTVQAMAGVMSITGFPDRPPVKAGPALCDFFAGTHLYGAIVTALYEREKTGLGRQVEVAMLDAVYPSLSSSLGLYHGSQREGSQREDGAAACRRAPATAMAAWRRRRTTSTRPATATSPSSAWATCTGAPCWRRWAGTTSPPTRASPR